MAYYFKTCLGVIGDTHPEPLLFLEEEEKKPKHSERPAEEKKQLEIRQDSSELQNSEFDTTTQFSDIVPGYTEPPTTITFSSAKAPTATPPSSTKASSATHSAVLSTSSPGPKISGGAIGGIVVGVVAILAILSALAFFCIRRRRSDRKSESQLPEMQAVEISYEMPGKDDTSKTPTYPVPYDHTKDGFYVPYGELGSQQYELENNPVISPTTASELASDSTTAAPELSSTTPRDNKAYIDTPIAVSPVATSSSGTGSESKLSILRGRMDKIRAEKERLLKVQELEEMEAAVQREIMGEQMREMEASRK
jgi:hypothetical protein